MFLLNNGRTAVDTWVDSPTFEGSYFPSGPFLDVTSSVDTTLRRLALNVVNRNHEAPYRLDLNLFLATASATTTTRLSGELDDANDFRSCVACADRTT